MNKKKEKETDKDFFDYFNEESKEDEWIDEDKEYASRFRSLLVNLKDDNLTMVLMSLQELAEILSVSTEDSLAFFSTDAFMKELVRIMKGPEVELLIEGDQPEIMLLACRCICNLLDAMPSAVTSVVFHGVIRVLCQKLKEIQYIDLAEQALYALEKIAGQLPRAVVHEGGLSAALMYFDFFSIHAQRIALRTASNCMRSLDGDAFSQVVEVTPTLMNTIQYSDRTVVELSCLCWVRIAESYRSEKECLEQVLSVELLHVLFTLMPTPGNTNAVRPSTFQDLLRIFRAISKSSPQLSLELLQHQLIQTFYCILTNNSQPLTLDPRWRDCLPIMMKIVVDVLPPLPKDDMFSSRRFKDTPVASRTRSRHSPVTDVRVQFLEEDADLLHEISTLLVPLTLDVYASTVNLRVRQLVTHTLVKLMHYSSPDTLKEVLTESFSSFISGILTRQEHPVLVLDALYQTELLIKKLPHYQQILEREGVIHEIELITKEEAETEEEEEEVDRGLGKGSTRKHIIQLAQYFMDHYHKQQEPSHSLHELTMISTSLPASLHQLSAYLQNTSLSSFELIHSGLIKELVQYVPEHLSLFKEQMSSEALLQLIQCLHEILSRFESFEVITPMESTSDKNPTSMLAKQLRLRLIGEGDDIPAHYRQLMVSTHAVATFRVLEEYLLSKMNTAGEEDSEEEHMLDEMELDEEEETVIMKEDFEIKPEVKEGGWKIVFKMKDKEIANDSTVYAAVHDYKTERPIWNASFPVTYRRVWINNQEEKKKEKRVIVQPEMTDVCYQVLMLMKALSPLMPPETLVHRKLTAKMNKQLEEPLIVASQCLPDWTYWLMQMASFLFPFDTRYLFIQSTSFGYARLISRWQTLQMRNRDEHQPLLGRMERQKVRIMRHQMLESAMKILDMFGSLPSVLEIEYMGEEGTGLGPTLEFYAATSKEFTRHSLQLWHPSPLGLFPKTLSSQPRKAKKQLALFKTLGMFVAKALLDFRIIDLAFHPAFFHVVLDNTPPSLSLLAELDPVLAQSFSVLQQYIDHKQRIYAGDKSLQDKMKAVEGVRVDGAVLADLCLDFTLPGDTSHELKAGGAEIAVTMQNIEEYMQLVIEAMTGSGIRQQTQAFKEGFNQLFSIEDLSILSTDELVSLFGRADEDWSYATLADTIKADHGFSMDSPVFVYLLETLAEMSAEERRQFLQFTTGSPRLPIGGWKALRPVFTVVRKVPEPPFVPNDYLPSVMTCANYLKMPDYSTKDVLKQKLKVSMTEGQNSFLLS